MLTDILTIAWKEWKEVLRFHGGFRSGLGTLFLILVVFGIFMPIQFERLWVETLTPLGMWMILPVVLVTSLVADSFAGERERHTLEMLLASRLSDRSILLGKIAAVVSYAWLVTQLAFIVALVPVNVLFGEGTLLVYSAEVVLCGMGLSLLLAGLMTNVGILVSLRAATVRQAQQTLGLSIFLLVGVLPQLGLYLLKYLPEETRQAMREAVMNGNIVSVASMAALALVAGNMLLFVISSRRFQRTRLILD
jgi:ABC-2 type transport system permease protein